MSAQEHHGVGAIVTNASRSRFFVQQKDASYPRFPRGYSMFGGAREPGESPRQALARELDEELGPLAAALLETEPVEVLTTSVAPHGFRYSLFEIVVNRAQLEALASAPVFEGERGVVVGRTELAALPFVWGLDQVVSAYLSRL